MADRQRERHTGRGRLQRRHWLTPAVLALVLLAILVTGGFRAAPGIGVRSFAVGREIDLRRWTLVVSGVELVDTTSYDSPEAPALRVDLTATWNGNRSVYGLTHDLVAVVVPGGPAPDPEGTTDSEGTYSAGGYDPGVPRPLVLEFTWPADATETSPPTPAPDAVQVTIRDERPAQNFLYDDEWTATRPIGRVTVPVVDRRARR